MRRFLVSLCLAVHVLAAHAQADEAALRARVVGQPLILRGCWTGDTLEFDSNGAPTKPYATASVTLSGVDIQKVKLESNTVELDGIRVGLQWQYGRSRADKPQIKRIPLPSSEKRKAPPAQVKIIIDRSGDLTHALDRIFADGFGGMTKDVPSVWRYYARDVFKSDGQPKPITASDDGQGPVWHIGGSIIPPRLISSVDPAFTSVARTVHMNGNVQLYLVLGEDGKPQRISIVRPLGLGLDENAIAAVEQYRFIPAKRNGEPLPVDLYIDVNFQVF